LIRNLTDGVFTDLVTKANLHDKFEIDSAGTISYHAGELPHHGTLKVLAKHGISYSGHSRHIQRDDLNHYDYLIMMDSTNFGDVRSIDRQKQYRHKLFKLLDFSSDRKGEDVPDPYYTGKFDQLYDMVLDACQGLLAHIREKHDM